MFVNKLSHCVLLPIIQKQQKSLRNKLKNNKKNYNSMVERARAKNQRESGTKQMVNNITVLY